MIFDMSRQVTLFIFSLLSGMTVGVLFDFYRVIRGFEDPGKVITAIQDILFWILTGVLIFLFMMYTNYAYMSFNVLMYNCIGLFLYFKLFSCYAVKLWDKVFNVIMTIIRVIINWVFYPLRIIFHKLRKKT